MTVDRTAELSDLLARRILILDGAMGTMIQSYRLQEADYRGERFRDWPSDLKGNNDLLALTQPGDHPRDSRRLSGGRRGHHRDQYLQFHFESPCTTTAWRVWCRN